MRSVQGFSRFIALLCFVFLSVALLLGAPASPGFASHTSKGTHACAPLAPPPVAGSPVPPPSTPGIVLFNEILTNPGSTWNCSEPTGTFSIMSDSWIELYNPQSRPFNLYAVHAYIDTGPNTFRFYLPFGADVAPNGFLVVFPNSAASSTLLAGSNLRLMFAASDMPIDQVNIPGLVTDDSFGRIPDGSSTWQITTTPTINASNIETSSTTPTPNPSTPQGSSGSGSSGSSGSSGGTGSTQTASTPPFATGTQPAWNKLVLPQGTAAASPTNSVVNPPLTNTPSPASANSASDVQHRILLTVLLILLAGSLFWCWKVYSS